MDSESRRGRPLTRNVLNCDTATAVSVVNDLMGSRMRQFERIRAVEPPMLFDTFRIDGAPISPDARAAVANYVRELQDWMAGVLKWHLKTRRYMDSELRRPASFVPTPPLDLSHRSGGLGNMAAALIDAWRWP